MIIILPLYSAGWSFGSLEGAAQYPHDSGAAAGILVMCSLALSWTQAARNPDALTQCLFHSLPESGCPLMPSVNKAQMRRLHLLQNPWSSHGRSFWVIIIFVLCLLQAVQNCFYKVLGDIFCMSKAVRHACFNAYRSSWNRANFEFFPPYFTVTHCTLPGTPAVKNVLLFFL